MYFYTFTCNVHNFLSERSRMGKPAIILLILSRDKKYEYFEEPWKSSFYSTRAHITSSFELLKHSFLRSLLLFRVVLRYTVA